MPKEESVFWKSHMSLDSYTIKLPRVILKYSLIFYLLLGLNLQPPDDFTKKYFPTNTGTRSWLTELEKSTPVDEIKGSVRGSV